MFFGTLILRIERPILNTVLYCNQHINCRFLPKLRTDLKVCEWAQNKHKEVSYKKHNIHCYSKLYTVGRYKSLVSWSQTSWAKVSENFLLHQVESRKALFISKSTWIFNINDHFYNHTHFSIERRKMSKASRALFGNRMEPYPEEAQTWSNHTSQERKHFLAHWKPTTKTLASFIGKAKHWQLKFMTYIAGIHGPHLVQFGTGSEKKPAGFSRGQRETRSAMNCQFFFLFFLF